MSNYSRVNVKFGADISEFSTAMQNAVRDMTKAANSLTSVGMSLTKSLTLPIVALGGASLYAFGEIDKLKRGLVSVMGSAGAASKEFNDLVEIAKLPGLGLEEVTRGDVNLQAIGLTAAESKKAISELGNAIATVGGGRENFDLAVRGFGQLSNASKPLQQDLYQIANQVPQINKILIETFGTNRAEDLAKLGISGKQLADILISKLGELPRATGGISNAFENMRDSVKIALANLGESIDKNLNITDKINGIGEAISKLTGWFADLNPVAQTLIIAVAGIVAALGPLLLVIGSIVSIMPTIVAGWAALSTAFAALAGPVSVAIIGITALSVLVYKLLNPYSLAAEAQNEFTQTLKTATSGIQDNRAELSALVAKLKDTNLKQDERNTLIGKFNSLSGQNLQNISDETLFQKKLAEAYEDTVTAMNKKKYAAIEDARIQKENQLTELQTQIAAQKAKADAAKIRLPLNLGYVTSTPISDVLYGSEQDRLIELENQAEITRQTIQNLNRELYKVSTTGNFAPEVVTPKKPAQTKEEIEAAKQAAKTKADAINAQLLKSYTENEAIQNDIALRLSQNDSIQRALQTNSEQTNIVAENGFNNMIITTSNGWNGINEAQDKGASVWMQKWAKLTADARVKFEQFNQQISDMLKNELANILTEAFAQIGQNLATGQDPFKDVGKNMLNSVGQFLQKMGGAFITFGITYGIAQDAAISGNYAAIIGAGAAMVAAGAAISSIQKKGIEKGSAGSSYGGSSYGGASGGEDLTLTATLHGDDLYLSGQRSGLTRRR